MNRTTHFSPAHAAGSKTKLYCYVDETGQDTTSSLFLVVAVVNALKCASPELTVVEVLAGTGHRKHTSPGHAGDCDTSSLLALEGKLGGGGVLFGSYPKPLPYFFPLFDVLEQAIKVWWELAGRVAGDGEEQAG